MIDNRILCTDCRELAGNGDCMAAKERRRLDVSKYYGPAEIDLPRRCAFFAAKRGASDPRSGRERYPELWAEYEALLASRREVRTRGIAMAKAAIA